MAVPVEFSSLSVSRPIYLCNFFAVRLHRPARFATTNDAVHAAHGLAGCGPAAFVEGDGGTVLSMFKLM